MPAMRAGAPPAAMVVMPMFVEVSSSVKKAGSQRIMSSAWVSTRSVASPSARHTLERAMSCTDL